MYVCMYVCIKYTIKTHQHFKFMYVCRHQMSVAAGLYAVALQLHRARHRSYGRVFHRSTTRKRNQPELVSRITYDKNTHEHTQRELKLQHIHSIYQYISIYIYAYKHVCIYA